MELARDGRQQTKVSRDGDRTERRLGRGGGANDSSEFTGGTARNSKHLADEIGRQLGVLGYPVPDDFEDDDLGLATSLNVGRLSSLRKDALEVTVPIVPGKSGGPVFIAETGEIVGIAESRFDDERSIGFALPIDEAKTFLHKYDAVHGF